MLSIRKVSIRSADYYLHLAQKDYYTQGGEPPGKWHGKGASALGLSGAVTREQFENLFQGFSPDGKTALVQNAGQKSGYHQRVPGWDLTLSPPKSVSVCWALGTQNLRDSIERAHEEAVRTALTQMDHFAGVTRRGSGGNIFEKANFCYALFEHGTSRALDPQLHTHAICFNIAFRSDGTTGAVFSEDLYNYKMAIGALYRCELASILQKTLHLPVEKVGTSFEITGVSAELIELFSSRRQEILEYCKQHGIYSAVEAEKAAIATRGEKEHVARDLLFRQWEDISFKVGWTQSNIAALFDKSVAARDWTAEMIILAEDVELALRQSDAKPTKARLIQAVAQEAQASGLTARQALEAAFSGLDYANKTLTPGSQATDDHFGERLSEAQTKTREVNESIEKRNGEVRAERMKQEWAEGAAKHKASQEAKKSKESKKPRKRSKRPAKNLKHLSAKARRRKRKPFAVLKLAQKDSRFGQPSWSLEMRFVDIEVHKMRIFYKAPKWHPFHYIKLPIPLVRNKVSPMRVIRRASIPLAQTRHAAAEQIKGSISAAFALGARIVLLNDQRVERWGAALERVGQGVKLLKQLRRPQTLLAQSDQALWRGLLEDWGRDGRAHPDRNVMLTQTRAAADRLNKTAQETRLKEGRIGKAPLNVRGVEIHRNDRILINRADKWNNVKIYGRGTRKARYQVKVGDVGIVTDLQADRFSVRLDSGVTVEYTCDKFPRVSLAYAMAHQDSGSVKPKRAFILFEGNDVEKEYVGIRAAAENSRVRTYVTEDHARHFTVEGIRDIKRSIGAREMELHDQARDSAEARHEEETLRKKPESDLNKDEYLDAMFPDPPSKPQPYAVNDWYVEGTEHLFAYPAPAEPAKSGTSAQTEVKAEQKEKQGQNGNHAEEERRRAEEERSRQEEKKRQEEELRRQHQELEEQNRVRHTHGHSY